MTTEYDESEYESFERRFSRANDKVAWKREVAELMEEHNALTEDEK